MIDVKTDRKTVEIISRIANRADTLDLITKRYDRLTCVMDLEAASASCKPPLDLSALFEFDDSNFIHDITGIARHMNRSTGQLENCFLPRCSRSAEPA